ncbi:hypothetical protein EDD18DRAFT_1375962 [Armillaria luteobubalina]|uniref:CCHC-type domain-containing protein n=1 Tax=Armillaria luteobubalina TaxID=153913 RepID=A0AA39UV67_9AGAR|nr:hypothetical protein EDD18DRAFT_1375962 [Armillaria luteobubalina]
MSHNLPPEDPLLAQLATVLSLEAYHALEPIMQSLATRFISTENAANIAQQNLAQQNPLPQLQEALQMAFAGANFTIQTSGTNAGGRASTLRIDLPVFKGTRNENIRAWLSILDDQLSASHIAVADRTVSASGLLHDNGQTWYLALKQTNNDRPLSWDDFCAALLQEFDSPTRIDELRSEMDRVHYSGDVSNYCLKFQRVEMQISEDEMTFGDWKYFFLKHLPHDLQVHIRKATPPNMAGVYESARFWEQLHCTGNRGVFACPSGSSNHPRGFRPTLAMRMPPFTLPSTHYGSPSYSAAPPSSLLGPGPMDLDNFEHRHSAPLPQHRRPKDKSKVKCYGCGKIGHYIRECRTTHHPAPQNPSQPGPSCPRQPMFLFDSGAETNALDGEAKKFLQDVVDQLVKDTDEDQAFYLNKGKMEAYPLMSPLLNLDPKSPSDDPLPIYDVYIACCINCCCRFLGSPCYITVKAIVDTGLGSSYISHKKAEEIKVEIMEITPQEVHGAGKTVIYAFTKFMVQTGPIKEVTLAYILEEGSGFQYDLLLRCNWM